MDEDLDEREMNALRQKALSTLPPKRKERRARQDTEYDMEKVVARERERDFSHKSSRSQYHSHTDPHKLHDQRRATKARGRARKGSSSRSSSHSYSGSRSYSSYSSSASSTSGSRSHSSSSVSHSSYSSYTRSSYSSSRRSFSTSPHSRRTRTKHLSLDRGPHSEPRGKTSSKLPPSRHYPPSSQWHDDSYNKLHSYTSSRSPPRTRKGYPLPSHHSSRDYHDYPPAKRRHTDYPDYHRGPPPSERRRLHSPPPPPPPPALQRKERIIRHVRRSPPPRSPPPHSSVRSLYSRRPPSPPPHYPPHRHSHRTYRRSYSPPPPLVHSHDVRSRREGISDHLPSRPSSRDMRSLCGPPIHVRDRPHHRSPERRLPRLPPRRPSYTSVSRSSSMRSRRLDISRRRDGRPMIRSGVDSDSKKRDAPMREKAEPKRKEELSSDKNDDGNKTPVDEQGNSSGPPSLTSPTTAQLLWDEEEVLESKKEEVTVEGREEGEVEELDYDESMEDLDLHPTGNIDEGGGNEPRRLSVKSEERPGTVNWDDPEGDVGENEDRESIVDGDELLDVEPEDRTSAPEVDAGEDGEDGDEEGKGVHISSPIRVSPDRKKSRVKCSPRQKEQGIEENKLSVKERLYVSRNTIEEKKRRLSRRSDDTSSKLPRSLANRLGPSPGLHGRVGRRSEKSISGGHKGSALAIAAEYKRRRQAGELSPREAARATRITKRINAPDYRPQKHSKPEEKSEENERELDKKIDSIKKRNRALEKRHKEIERDKQLYA